MRTNQRSLNFQPKPLYTNKENSMESEFPTELRSQCCEVLSSNDNDAMDTLFSHLHSPSPQHSLHRSQAHTFFQCCKKHHPDLLFIKLFFLLRCSPRVETRANAARVLRLLRSSDLWPKLRATAQLSLKSHFLDYLREEDSLPVLRMACVVVAETASAIYNAGQRWPELLEFLLRCLAMNDDKFREIALLVLGSLPKDCRSLVCEALNGAVQGLHSSFLSALASANPDVQVASFGAVVSVARLFSDASNRSRFHELLRAMMIGVFTLLNGFQDSYFRRAFVELISLVSEEPRLLKPYMSDMVLDMLQIAESPMLNNEIPCLAMKLVITMTELKDCKSIFLNLPHQTMLRLLLIPMNMLLCIEEDNDVGNQLDGGEEEDVGDTGKIDVHRFGIKCLNRLSVTLGGSKVVPIASEMLPLYLDAPEWKKRHAGFTMLTVIAKEFSDEMILMENFLGEMVTKILKSFQDSHVQVRLAAFKFMEMPTNFVQVVQILYHRRLVHAFVTALDNDQNYNVKEQAASAMLFFLKNTLPESLTLYKNVDTVMGKLLPFFQGNESAKQRSIALSTFNIVAHQCREVAPKYCANYLPILLEACTDKNSEVKEEATRGIRIFAEFGTPQLKPFVNSILSELSILMQEPNRSLSENAKAYEIAVSALGRICEFHRDSIDGSKIVPAWLSLLPLKDDLTEAKLMHEQLCLMVARLDKDLLGAGNQNLVKIVAVFVEVIDKGDKLATAQTVKQMTHLLRQLWRHIPRSAPDAILLSLNAQQRELLSSLVPS